LPKTHSLPLLTLSKLVTSIMTA